MIKAVKKILSVILLIIMFSTCFIPVASCAYANPELIKWAAAALVAGGAQFSAEEGINPTCESFLEYLDKNNPAALMNLEYAKVTGKLVIDSDTSFGMFQYLQAIQNGEISEFEIEEFGYSGAEEWVGTDNPKFLPGYIDIQMYIQASRQYGSWVNFGYPLSHISIYIINWVGENERKMEVSVRGCSEKAVITWSERKPISTIYTVDLKTTPEGVKVIYDGNEFVFNIDKVLEGDVDFEGISSCKVAYFSPNVRVIQADDVVTVDPAIHNPTYYNEYVENTIINEADLPENIGAYVGEDGFTQTPEEKIVEEPFPAGYTLSETILNKINNSISSIKNTVTSMKTSLTNLTTSINTKLGDISTTISNALTVDFVGDLAIVDFGRMTDVFSGVTSKFPFSLPWDLFRAVEVFGEGQQLGPWQMSVNNPLSGAVSFEVAVPEGVEGYYVYIRWALLIIFDIGLLFATRKLLGGAS